MASDYSANALLKFLDYTAEKGLMNKNTAQSRKHAANKVLSVLDESEAQDLRAVDVDDIYERFKNLHGNDFKPDSLRVYHSRLSSAISDFLEWRSDPASFRPSVKKRRSVSRKSNIEPNREKESHQTAHNSSNTSSRTRRHSEESGISIPIPLRAGLMIEVSGVPDDLTRAEAKKIAAIVSAYAESTED